MKAIYNYNNTKRELEIAQMRLDYLLDKKEMIHSKYVSLTSKASDTPRGGGSSNSNKFVDYMVELTKVDDKTGKSLNQEISDVSEEVKELTKLLDTMTDNLINMNGIEYELYSQIVVKGNNISKAIQNTAEIYNISDRAIYKKYYPEIKKILKNDKSSLQVQ